MTVRLKRYVIMETGVPPGEDGPGNHIAMEFQLELTWNFEKQLWYAVALPPEEGPWEGKGSSVTATMLNYLAQRLGVEEDEE